MKFYKILILLFLGLTCVNSGCEKEYPNDLFPASEFISKGIWEGDYWPTEEWRFCAPEEVGMDPQKLRELNHEINILIKLHIDIHSVTIIKDGYIVAEQFYSEDYNANSLHAIYSCTKSLTSALVGIAVEKGFIESEQNKMVDYFKDYTYDDATGQKGEICLEDLLTMSAGLEWDELQYPFVDPRNSAWAMENSQNWIQYVLNQAIIESPGTTYCYNTGASHLLSAIVEMSTGSRTDLFARDHLFGPLGISDYQWRLDPQGIAYGGSGVMLKPRDMAKFGLLYLREGLWEDNQIIPKKWVEKSREKHMQRIYEPDFFYGYQFWVSDEVYYAAVGYGGQWIMIAPDSNLVVVFTNQFADGDGVQWTTPNRMMKAYILPSVIH